MPADVIRAIGVREDDQVDADALGAAISQAEPLCARKRALRLLGFRERSTHEISERLTTDGYDASVIRRLVQDLTTAGLINDARFAKALARTMTCVKHMGRARISAELTRRGIDGPAATAALEEYCDARSEADRATALAAALSRTCSQDTVRVTRRLMARGYSPGTASQAAQQACEHGAHLRQCSEDS